VVDAQFLGGPAHLALLVPEQDLAYEELWEWSAAMPGEGLAWGHAQAPSVLDDPLLDLEFTQPAFDLGWSDRVPVGVPIEPADDLGRLTERHPAVAVGESHEADEQVAGFDAESCDVVVVEELGADVNGAIGHTCCLARAVPQVSQ